MQPIQGQPIMGQPVQQPPMQTMQVQVPQGMQGGQMLQVQTPAGLMQVQIPPGLQSGQVFQMQVPMPQQQPVMAQAQPMQQARRRGARTQSQSCLTAGVPSRRRPNR